MAGESRMDSRNCSKAMEEEEEEEKALLVEAAEGTTLGMQLGRGRCPRSGRRGATGMACGGGGGGGCSCCCCCCCFLLLLLLLLLLGVVVVVASAGEAGCCCCCCCCRGRGGLVVERMGHHGCAWSLVSSATEQRRWARQEGVRRAGHGRRLGEGTAGGGGWVRAWVARGEMCVGGALQGQRRQNRRMACAYNPLLWREAQRGGVVQEWVPVGMGWEVDEGVWVGWYVRRGRGGVWCRALGGGPGDAEGTT